LWSDELGLSALLLESHTEFGGQLLRVYNPIKNHLGVETENGREMRDIFVKQIENRKFPVRFVSEVSDVDLKAKKVLLKNGECFQAKSLIIATGTRRRKLNITGEEQFLNQGIIDSGKRNQNLVKGKIVSIVGGGDAALENALILSETASQVFLVHRRKEFRARTEFIEKVLDNEKIKIFTETFVKAILGNETVNSIEVQHFGSGETTNLPIDFILLRIGVEPNTELFRKALKLDENHYIEINSNCETEIENVFAIGDVSNPLAPTISSAVGMGATVAKVLYDRLNPKM
jgi:thioredoxin reductase (NADPH)